jgi:hypothetical protein
MPSSSVLLIELLDGAGAHEADAALRARALRRAGLGVQPLVLDLRVPRGTAASDVPARTAALRREAAQAARREADSVRPAAVWIAGSRATAGDIAAALDAYEVRWWPTLLEPVEPRAADPGDRRLDIIGAGHVSAERRRFHALELAVVRAARVREPAPLWDGDFMLVPGPLERGGGDTLELFARVAAERPELDLVVLDDPQPETEQATRAIELFPRVHFAGPPTREAEHTWLATASTVLISADAPTAAALVLRALAVGAPVVPVGRSPGARLLREWLKLRLGIAAATAWDALSEALRHDVSMRNAVTAGRALATEHEPEALSERLFGSHPQDGEAREVA